MQEGGRLKADGRLYEDEMDMVYKHRLGVSCGANGPALC